jgi:mono/diheme cytochrome c family protein
MPSRPAIVALVVLLATAFARGSGIAATQSAAATAAGDAYHATVLPLLQKYCYECHGEGMSSGDLELDSYKTLTDIRNDTKTWQKVIQYARTQTMPPPKADQPTQDERDTLVEALHRELYQIDPANPDPGRVTVRRLNRSEYRNTIRDLVGVTNFDPTLDFPQDDTGYGFDNIGDVLTLPPMLMEKYLAATERILDAAIATDSMESTERRVPAARAQRSNKSPIDPPAATEWVKLSSRNEDGLSVAMQGSARADYIVRVLAYARPHVDEDAATTRPVPAEDAVLAPAQPIRLSILAGDALAAEFDVTSGADRPQWYEARVGVGAGKSTIAAVARRHRSPTTLPVSDGRIGDVQPGDVFVKEIVIEGPVQGAVRRVDNDRLEAGGNGKRNGEIVSLPQSGDEASATVEVRETAEHLIRVQACADFAGDEPARMELLVDGRPIATFEVTAPAGIKPSPRIKGLAKGVDQPVFRVHEVRTTLAAGKRKISARFLNDVWFPDHEEVNLRDRNLYVQDFEIVDLASPPLPRPMTPPMRELFVKHAGPAAAVTNVPIAHDANVARAILAEFTRRAWRRPPMNDEMARVMKLYRLAADNGEGFHASIKHAMKGVLVSSSFLFRGEPSLARGVGAKTLAEPIGEYELASRLSYFLWSTMPDDDLLALAERGELRKNLHAQVKRMLASNRSASFIDNFAGQWLQFRNLDAVHPDRKMFKVYTDRLRDAMIRETQLFFTHIMREDRSLMDVLTADYTFVNELLATHYGFKDAAAVKGNEFKRVSLAGTPRRGVITHGSVLTLTSNPTRTSPVKRGKWVLENLLGSPPPPPPANVPPLDNEGRQLKGTLRQRLEQHRESKACASCHAPLDPIGFGLENFDPIGAFREKDGDAPVDATSAFVNGPTFTGSIELVELLARTRKKDFYRSVAEASLTFALGRGVEPYDQPAVERIVRDLQANDGKFSTLIYGVVDSVPFQMRRADVPSGPAQASVGGITR